MPSSKKLKKKEKEAEKAFLTATRKARLKRRAKNGEKQHEKQQEEKTDREVFDAFEAAGGFGVDATAAKKRSKRSGSGGCFKTLAAIIRRCCAIAFFIIVASRGDFFSAFGAGTGVSKAHVSPMSVATRYLFKAEFVRNSYKIRTASEKVLTGVATMGEYMDEFAGMVKKKKSGLKSKKSKKSKKKKGKKKKNANKEDEETAWERAATWVKKAQRDRSLRRIVDRNHFLVGGSIICIVFGLLGVILPDVGVVTLVGLGTMLMGASRQDAPAQPESLIYVAMCVLILGYASGQYLSESGGSKKKKKLRMRRNQEKDLKETKKGQ